MKGFVRLSFKKNRLGTHVRPDDIRSVAELADGGSRVTVDDGSETAVYMVIETPDDLDDAMEVATGELA